MITIAIAGGSGSGKTTLAIELNKHLQTAGKQSFILCEDRYYKPLSEKQLREVENHDFDHPDAIDADLMVEQLRQLQQERSVEVPNYCYQTHTRLDESTIVTAGEIIILEGLHLLHRNDLLPLYDLKVFVESPLHVCLERRIARDVSERDRTEDSVRAQFAKTVAPNYKAHIHPSQNKADLVLDGTRPVQRSLNTLLRHPPLDGIRIQS